MKARDLTGLRFNYLTVLGEGTGVSRKKKYWKCLCDCGNITNVETTKLTSLQTMSCGCKKKGSQIEDLTGQTFGSLTVIAFSHTEKGKAYWKCKCVCGNEVVKQGKLLKAGKVTSCGCMHGKKKIKDLTGQVFGRLTVTGYAYSENNKCYWKCHCICGNDVVVAGVSLVNGNTRSCGCLKKINTTRIDLTGKRFGYLTALNYVRTAGKIPVWRCRCDCGRYTDVKSAYLIHGETKSCGCMTNFSFGEREVSAFIKSVYTGEVILNDRSTIAPKELDIYIPEKKVAIEYDGLYWHSEAGGKMITYHLDKTRRCHEQGIRLIHIYDYEWENKKDIVKSMLCSALGIYERKEFARKLEVREVADKKTVFDFFNENHIQGAVERYSLCLGLYKGEELLQAVAFGRQHFGSSNTIELYRMVTAKNVQVVGGFSKLMKHCPYDEVVSYVALRLFDGKGYLKGNWKIEHTAQPSFCITDGLEMYSRHLFKKEACLKKFDNVTEDMTEREMCWKNGFYRLWDCGTYKVKWHRY